MRPKIITAIDAVTATTTSAKIWVGNAKKVAFLFRRANDSSGSTAFTVKAGFAQSPSDSPTMTPYNMLVNNTENTNAEEIVHSNSVSLADNGDAMAWMDINCPATHVEVTATEATDGTHSAFVIVWE